MASSSLMNTQRNPFPLTAPDAAYANSRSKILAAWRGIDLSAAEALRHYRPKSIADLTRDLVKKLKLEQRQSETEILRVWAESIDPNITAHAQPTNLYNGTLFVKVDSNTWLHEIIRYRRKEILDRMQHSFSSKKIQRISFKIG